MRPRELLWCAWAAVLVSTGCDRAAPPAEPSNDKPSSASSSAAVAPTASATPSDDRLATSAGPVVFHPVHHATLWLEVAGRVVWIDPWSQGKLDGPKVDVVLLTDSHPDHLDAAAVAAVRKPDATIIGPRAVAATQANVIVLDNGQEHDLGFMRVRAVPMYNLTRGPKPGTVYHERGRGNGYLLEVGDRRIYLSGDTECTPEMKALEQIDVAFVCMNLPYTMTPTEAAECVRAFRPTILCPYHYRDSNLDELETALAGSGVEIRRRAWY
jgi:L-ascorbate metabolism protein UlaG (beta-lactamase superfamily)